MTPEQCAQMVRVRQDFLLAIRAVAQERHALTCVMQTIVPGFDANVDVATEHQKVRDCLEDLYAPLTVGRLLFETQGPMDP